MNRTITLNHTMYQIEDCASVYAHDVAPHDAAVDDIIGDHGKTARHIASRRGDAESYADFDFWRDELWQIAGHWVVAGEGHARTRYGRTHSDGSSGWGAKARTIDSVELEDYLASLEPDERDAIKAARHCTAWRGQYRWGIRVLKDSKYGIKRRAYLQNGRWTTVTITEISSTHYEITYDYFSMLVSPIRCSSFREAVQEVAYSLGPAHTPPPRDLAMPAERFAELSARHGTPPGGTRVEQEYHLQGAETEEELAQSQSRLDQ